MKNRLVHANEPLDQSCRRQRRDLVLELRVVERHDLVQDPGLRVRRNGGYRQLQARR